MKIRDLIQLLRQQNQEAQIYVSCEGYNNIFGEENTTKLCKINDDNFILCDDTRIEFSHICEEMEV